MRGSHAWEDISDGSSTRAGCFHFSCLSFLSRRKPPALQRRGAHAEAALGFIPPSTGVKISETNEVAASATQGLDQPASAPIPNQPKSDPIPGLQIEEEEDGEGETPGPGAASHAPESKDPPNDNVSSRISGLRDSGYSAFSKASLRDSGVSKASLRDSGFSKASEDEAFEIPEITLAVVGLPPSAHPVRSASHRFPKGATHVADKGASESLAAT